MTDTMRFEVRAKPGASGTSVGGTWGESGALKVSVPEKAVDRKANDAVLDILATVLKVRKRQLNIVHGVTHRTKVIEVTDPPPGTAELLDSWRARS